MSAALSSKSRRRRSAVGSQVSTASSVRLKAEMERATLHAQATALKQKQELERQEAELKAKREQLDLQTAIAASDAKLKVLKNFENERSSHVSPAYPMTIDSGFIPLSVSQTPVTNTENGYGEFMPLQNHPIGTQQSRVDFAADEQAFETLCTVMTRQNNITELMVKQQKMMTLPPLDIPTFSGDPLDYNTFVSAFEHGVLCCWFEAFSASACLTLCVQQYGFLHSSTLQTTVEMFHTWFPLHMSAVCPHL